ncbi:MAG TPA: hypothetical protein VGA95_07570 [Thermodesulfobacteriota bacterium]
MREKRIRTKLFQVWLHPKEFKFLTNYAEENLMTSSDLVRYWIRQAMEKDNLIKSVSIETDPKKGR